MTGMSCCQGEASGSPLRIFLSSPRASCGVSSSPSTTSARGLLPASVVGVVGAERELGRVLVGDELVDDCVAEVVVGLDDEDQLATRHRVLPVGCSTSMA